MVKPNVLMKTVGALLVVASLFVFLKLGYAQQEQRKRWLHLLPNREVLTLLSGA